MKRTIFTVSLVLCFNLLFSQYNLSGIGTSTDIARGINNKTKVNNYSQSRVGKSKLNYFLDDNWQGGVMFTEDSSSVNGYTYRYNIYTDQMELMS